jgi:hypothetical protein
MRATLMLCALSAIASIECGSGMSSGGVPGSTSLSKLSSQQARQLCDSVNAAQGGYGHSASCSGGKMQSTDADQASCVEGLSTIGMCCPSVTVMQVQDCANSAGTSLCGFDTSDACAALRGCLSSGCADGGST